MTSFPRARTECPRCGAGVELDAGDSVLQCPYCRTGLYLLTRGPLHYHLQPVEPVPERLVYLPFWRFRGLRYRFLPTRGLENGLVDATVPARDDLGVTGGLGIRPQVMALWLGDPGEGRAAPSVGTAADGLGRAERVVDDAVGRAGVAFTRFVGETVALIFAPFGLERVDGRWALVEALPDGRRAVLTAEETRRLHHGLAAKSVPQSIRPLPLRCPECGDDLPPVGGAVVFWCRRCARAWTPAGTRWVEVPYGVLPGDGAGERWFPFWEVAFTVKGAGFTNRGSLRRWAVDYQPVPEGWDRQSPTLLVPAFKVQPRTFVRLARNLSLAPLPVPSDLRFAGDGDRVEPARLCLAEAAQALKVVLAEMARGQKKKLDRLPGARVRVRRARLLLLPFGRQGGEWVEGTSGTAVQAEAVERGRGI